MSAASAERTWHEGFAGSRLASSPGLVVLRGLEVRRGRGDDVFTLAIDDLKIPRGSFTAILGGSGIGKTTLLTVLGLLRGPRDDPDFRMDCKDLSFHLAGASPREPERVETIYRGLHGDRAEREVSSRRRERLRRELIGFCLQGGELLPSLSLLDNCATPANLNGLPDPLQRSTRYLQRLGMVIGKMGNQSGKLPASLSGGQKQRGVLARSLVHDPDLVILDEPTTGLDRGTAREAVALLQRQARTHGQTVLMVTHDQRLADEFADVVIEMDLTGRRRSGISRIRVSSSEAPCAPGGSDGAVGASRRGTPFRRLLYTFRLGTMDALGPLVCRIGDAFARTPRPWQQIPGWKRQVRWSFPLQLLKNSLIVVAVGLLVLLMRGMRSGLVQDLRDDLAKSPTARQLEITTRLRGGALDERRLTALKAENPQVDVVIPQMSRLKAWTDTTESRDSQVDLVVTAPPDPVLKILDRTQDFSGLNADTIVVYAGLAKKLKVKVGDAVSLWFVRETGSDEVEPPQKTTLQVANIVREQEGESIEHTAYVHLDFAEQVDRFQSGRPVESRGWKGIAKDVPPQYAAHVVFSKGELGQATTRDLSAIGLEAVLLEPGDPRSTLHGLLAPPAEGDPAKVYLLKPELSDASNPMPLRADQARLPEILVKVQGILFHWNEPLDADVDGIGPVRLVGASGWERWLLPRLAHPEVLQANSSGTGAATWRASPAVPGEGTELRTLRVKGERKTVELSIDVVPDAAPAAPNPAPAPPAAGPKTLFVPAEFLARLRLTLLGEAEPDSDRRAFLAAREARKYYSARVFVKDIDHVLPFHKNLEGQGFHVDSSRERVLEIQGYAGVLDHLTRIVSVLAALTALLTVGVVFHEIAESKKRMIGTLRIMGLSRFGAKVLLLSRGVLVALLASVLVVGLGLAAAAALNAVRPGLCILHAEDFGGVALGIGVVCLLGTWWPAHRVSRVDPVVALQQAEER